MKAIIVGDLLKVNTYKWTPEDGKELDLYNGLLFDIDAFKDADSIFKFRIDSKNGVTFLEKAKKLVSHSVKVTGFLTTRDGERIFTAIDIDEVK